MQLSPVNDRPVVSRTAFFAPTLVESKNMSKSGSDYLEQSANSTHQPQRLSSPGYTPFQLNSSPTAERNVSSQTLRCTACEKPIEERFLLKALDQFWHEDCLTCSCCDCRLGEVGSTLFTKANLLLCRRDYLRLFGTTGYCAACNKMIPAFEMVMRARGNVYHLECFACQQCNHRFCVGDRFYLCENKVLCEFDYEDRNMFVGVNGSRAYHDNQSGARISVTAARGNDGGIRFGSNSPFVLPYQIGEPTYNALSQMKRQTQNLSDDMSSGYGSPSPTSV